MNLYELNELSKEALAGAIDEQGEILDDRLIELLEEIQIEKENKIRIYTKIIKNIKKDYEAFEEEKKRLESRMETLMSKVDYYKNQIALTINEGEKFKFPWANLYWMSTESTQVDVDPQDLWKQYPDLVKVKTEYAPIKDAIKERIESGELVFGCRIQKGKALVIK